MTNTVQRAEQVLGGNRDFTLLWIGQAVSTLGSTTVFVTYPLLVLFITESPSLVAVTMAVAMLARLVAGLPGGALVDRMDKRRLMLGCDAIRAVSQAVIVLGLLGGWLEFSVLLVMVAVEGALSAVFAAAEPAAVRHVLRPDQLALGLARNEARNAGAMLAGPTLGGLMFGLAPWLPFLFDTISYLVSFVFIAFIRSPMASSIDGSEKGLRGLIGYRDIVEGLGFVWRQRFLRVTLLLISGNNLVSNAITMVAIVVSQQRGDAGITTGMILTIASVGTLAGALLAPRIVSLLTVRTILILNRCLWVGLISLMLVVDNTYLVGGLIGGMFFLGPAGNTAVTTRQMRLTPDEMQGRARGAVGVLVGVAAPVGTGAVGLTLDTAGLTASILVLVGWMVLMTLIAIVSRAVREDGAVKVTDTGERTSRSR